MDLLSHKRPQLRVALNSRCGRACFYCRPSGEAVATHSGVEIAPDDLVFFTGVAAEFGMRDIKFTGGDPALYSHLTRVVREIKQTTAVETIEIISRHPRIGQLAPQLKAAGADRFNVSLDTLDRALHKRICGVDDLDQLIAAVTDLVRTGLPLKVNMVVMNGINENEIYELIAFCQKKGVHSLKLLDVIGDLDGSEEFNSRRLRRQTDATSLAQLYAPLPAVVQSLKDEAVSWEIQHQGDLGHPMTVLTMPGGLRVIVKDSTEGAWYGNVCTGCKFYPCHDALMALRLTADLRAQICLLREDIAIDLAPLIRTRNAIMLRNMLSGICRTYDSAKFVSNAAPRATDAVA
ncbi:radical SAM protein [Bradyrhizobium sp. HKCCYLRH1062]|uniref:radical SAM protein n=1 Tax=unclassified Bradyrhizobium TaxID=2631580 RepID=UPI003EBC8C8D